MSDPKQEDSARKASVNTGEPVVAQTTTDIRSQAEKLISGAVNPHTMAVDALFDLARACVSISFFAGRDGIYGLIENHPHASPDHVKRVHINHADNVRRSGNAREALRLIDEIQPAESALVNAERLQVEAQSYLILSRNEPGVGHEQMAVDVAQQILDLCESCEIPLDKRVFYHQSFAGIKEAVGQYDDDLFSALRGWENLVRQMPEDAVRLSEESRYYTTRGLIEQKQGNIKEAYNCFYASFELGQGEYYKLDGAMRCLTILAGPDGSKAEIEGTSTAIADLRRYIEESFPLVESKLQAAYGQLIKDLRAVVSDINLPAV